MMPRVWPHWLMLAVALLGCVVNASAGNGQALTWAAVASLLVLHRLIRLYGLRASLRGLGADDRAVIVQMFRNLRERTSR